MIYTYLNAELNITQIFNNIRLPKSKFFISEPWNSIQACLTIFRKVDVLRIKFLKKKYGGKLNSYEI